MGTADLLSRSTMVIVCGFILDLCSCAVVQLKVVSTSLTKQKTWEFSVLFDLFVLFEGFLDSAFCLANKCASLSLQGVLVFVFDYFVFDFRNAEQHAGGTGLPAQG